MALFRFETRDQPVASPAVFVGRLGANLVVALLVIGVALGAGMIGYRVTEHMNWLDAFLNASMLLGGMGPIDVTLSEAGKLFAGIYALACGVIILLTTGVVLAPALHRVLHALHAADASD